TTIHRYVVSTGPRHDQLQLPPNCWGQPHLPQTSILPLVDLVITHGGNNTVTESVWFGRPMLVLPLTGDQYDNAQRITEKGFGARLDPFTFEARQLAETVDWLLSDQTIRDRLQKASARAQAE